MASSLVTDLKNAEEEKIETVFPDAWLSLLTVPSDEKKTVPSEFLRLKNPKKDTLRLQTKGAVYPSEWFSKHPGQKPPLIVPQIPANISYVQLTNGVLEAIKTSRITLELAKLFIYESFVKNPAILNDEWKSFGLIIGQAGSEVTINEMATVTREKTNIEIPNTTTDAPSKAVKWMLIYLCAALRLERAGTYQYRKHLVDQINTRLKANSAPDWVTANAVLMFMNMWVSDKQYRALLALVDMFLNKFPRHDFSETKMSTLVSRNRDCGAVTSFQYICQITGMEIQEIVEWVWVLPVARSIFEIIQPNNEIFQYDSYMPYFMDLGLSPRSPYSINAHPELHIFIHVLGCNSGNKQSKTARFINSVHIDELITNAVVMSYSLRTYCHFQMFCSLGSSLSRDIENKSLLQKYKNTNKTSNPQDMPKNNNGLEWLAWLKHVNLKLPPVVRGVARMWENFENNQKGTLGRYLFEKVNSYTADFAN